MISYQAHMHMHSLLKLVQLHTWPLRVHWTSWGGYICILPAIFWDLSTYLDYDSGREWIKGYLIFIVLKDVHKIYESKEWKFKVAEVKSLALISEHVFHFREGWRMLWFIYVCNAKCWSISRLKFDPGHSWQESRRMESPGRQPRSQAEDSALQNDTHIRPLETASKETPHHKIHSPGDTIENKYVEHVEKYLIHFSC